MFAAAGTASGPKGLIQQIRNTNPGQTIHLFWGARDEQDLYLDGLAREWERDLPGLTYTPVLSESSSDDWQGETGFVHEAVCRAYEDVSGYDVYASGPPIMVDSLRESLTKLGLDTTRYFFDSFDYAPRT